MHGCRHGKLLQILYKENIIHCFRGSIIKFDVPILKAFGTDIPSLWPDRNAFPSSFNANSRLKEKGIELPGILEHFGQSWKKSEGKKAEGVWWEGSGAGPADPGLCFDSIRWGQQGQTQDWSLRAGSPCLRSVWKLSQLCSLILQLNSIQGQIRAELGVWRCRCARRFEGMEGWKDGDNGQLVLPFPACAIPAVARWAPIPVTPFQSPSLTLRWLFFFFFPKPKSL